MHGVSAEQIVSSNDRGSLRHPLRTGFSVNTYKKISQTELAIERQVLLIGFVQKHVHAAGIGNLGP